MSPMINPMAVVMDFDQIQVLLAIKLHLVMNRHVVDASVQALIAKQLLDADCKLTERGAAYCDALLEVPLPTACWKIVWPENDIDD